MGEIERAKPLSEARPGVVSPKKMKKVVFLYFLGVMYVFMALLLPWIIHFEGTGREIAMEMLVIFLCIAGVMVEVLAFLLKQKYERQANRDRSADDANDAHDRS